MIFTELQFWVFFAVVTGLYVVLRHPAQNRMLLVVRRPSWKKEATPSNPWRVEGDQVEDLSLLKPPTPCCQKSLIFPKGDVMWPKR